MNWTNFSGSFLDLRQRGLAIPGVVLELPLSGKSRRIIIGDMSQYGSVQNGDRLELDTLPVTRYSIVWQPIVRGRPCQNWY